MSKKGHTPEQVINKLRQAEVELANGATVAQACKKIGVTEQTYYRWRAEYAGVHVCSDTYDTFFANRSYAMLHTATAGDKRMVLTEPADVTELVTGRSLGPVNVIEEALPAGVTRDLLARGSRAIATARPGWNLRGRSLRSAPELLASLGVAPHATYSAIRRACVFYPGSPSASTSRAMISSISGTNGAGRSWKHMEPSASCPPCGSISAVGMYASVYEQ